MQAMAAPVISHLDPAMMSMLDDLRERLSSAFRAGDGAFSFAISGTGTSAMETAVANVTKPGFRALVVVGGYFGDRLAQMLERYGAAVSRLQVEWGRACDPEQLARALQANGADLVAMVHGETSTGVVNPIQEMIAVARQHGALTIVDAVTTLGGVPLMTGEWDAGACYSCTQKGLGAPSGLAPITFSKRALESRVPSRSFYLDLGLLEEFGIEIGAGLGPLAGKIWRVGVMGAGSTLSNILLFLSAFERAVGVPDGVDEPSVRRRLLEEFGIEIGAGLGPLAGKIWRVGVMGAGSTLSNILLFLSAFERVLRASGHRAGSESAAVAAAERVVASV